MEITDIQIFPIRQNADLFGFGSFVLNRAIRISGIGLHTNRHGGIRITFPAKKVGQGYVYYAQPLDEEITIEIEKAFEARVKEVGLFGL